MDEWIISYRGYTDAELSAEIERLRKQSTSPFISQTQGSRSFQRSTAEVRERLSAATMVRSERSQARPPCEAIADFSQVQP
jgi:hypothetical protein